jgi:hypothetical protein
MAILQFKRPRAQCDSRGTAGLFFILPAAEQRARIRKLAGSRLNAATIASITGMQVSQVERIIAGADERGLP